RGVPARQFLLAVTGSWLVQGFGGCLHTAVGVLDPLRLLPRAKRNLVVLEQGGHLGLLDPCRRLGRDRRLASAVKVGHGQRPAAGKFVAHSFWISASRS